MAHISRFLFYRHLRAEPNQYILHYRDGKLVRSGAGLTYWFYPLSAAVAQVPVEDVQTTFVLRERSSDVQEVTVQATLTYRIADAEREFKEGIAELKKSIKLRQKYWVPAPFSINLKPSKPYTPKRGLLGSLGFTSAEAALIRKDLRGLTRRKEMIVWIAVPLALSLISLFSFQSSWSLRLSVAFRGTIVKLIPLS